MASASGGRALYPAELRALTGQLTELHRVRPQRLMRRSRRLAAVDLRSIFLGTGGSVPSARRSTASVLIARGGERLMFDCGEGTQRQMQRSLGLVQVDEIYLTHFHADHILGLPGLLKTYDLTDREAPLTIYGPPGLRDLFAILKPIVGRLDFELELVELAPGDAVAHDGLRDPALRGRPRRPRQRLRAGRGRAPRPLRRRGGEAPRRAGRPGLRGAAARGGGRRARRAGAPRGRGGRRAGPGRTVVITGDTAPCPATVAAAADAELLIHDASFAEEEVQRAAETGHSTVGQAAAVAREAHVKMLALVHISSRYHVGKVLEEAQEVFEPTVAPQDFDLDRDPLPREGRPRARPERSQGAAARSRVGPRPEPPRSSRGRGHTGPAAPAATLRPSFNPVP